MSAGYTGTDSEGVGGGEELDGAQARSWSRNWLWWQRGGGRCGGASSGRSYDEVVKPWGLPMEDGWEAAPVGNQALGSLQQAWQVVPIKAIRHRGQ